MQKIYKCKTMATGYGLSGKIRGKLGAHVYRIEAGKQIISEYNPEKQDRKSDGQLKQRAKMSTATRVSKVFPWESLVGFSTNRSVARRIFVKSICNKVNAVYVTDRWQATYDMTQAIFSDKAQVLYSNKSINTTSPENTQFINCSITFPESVDVKRFQMIVAFCPNVNSIPDRALMAMSSERNTSGQCTASVELSNLEALSAGVCYVYAVPIVPDTLKKKTRYNELVHTNLTNVLSADVYVEFARADMLMGSIYVGTHIFS